MGRIMRLVVFNSWMWCLLHQWQMTLNRIIKRVGYISEYIRPTTISTSVEVKISAMEQRRGRHIYAASRNSAPHNPSRPCLGPAILDHWPGLMFCGLDRPMFAGPSCTCSTYISSRVELAKSYDIYIYILMNWDRLQQDTTWARRRVGLPQQRLLLGLGWTKNTSIVREHPRKIRFGVQFWIVWERRGIELK